MEGLRQAFCMVVRRAFVTQIEKDNDTYLKQGLLARIEVAIACGTL